MPLILDSTFKLPFVLAGDTTIALTGTASEVPSKTKTDKGTTKSFVMRRKVLVKSVYRNTHFELVC